MSEELEAITRLMRDYFDGLYNSDADLLRKVFHPQARYVCATDDPLVDLSMEEYLPIVEKREPPSARGETRRDSIVSIELAGPVTGFVRANCAIGPRYFTDLLTVIKSEGRWRIISKVFHYDLDPARQK